MGGEAHAKHVQGGADWRTPGSSVPPPFVTGNADIDGPLLARLGNLEAKVQWLGQETESAAVARGHLVERLNRLEGAIAEPVTGGATEAPFGERLRAGLDGLTVVMALARSPGVVASIQAMVNQVFNMSLDVTRSTQSGGLETGPRVRALERWVDHVKRSVPATDGTGTFLLQDRPGHTVSPPELGKWIQWATQQHIDMQTWFTRASLVLDRSEAFLGAPEDYRRQQTRRDLEQGLDAAGTSMLVLEDYVKGPVLGLAGRDNHKALGGWRGEVEDWREHVDYLLSPLVLEHPGPWARLRAWLHRKWIA